MTPETSPHAPPQPTPPPPRPTPTWLTPGPLPAGAGRQLLFGLAQPLLGLRIVLREPALRRLARAPVLLLLVFATLVAWGTDGDLTARATAFLATLVSFAPVPVILFGKTYRDLAAASREPLGLPPRRAAHPSLVSSIGDAIRQSLLLAVALVPLYLAAKLLGSLLDLSGPLVWAVWAVGGVWTLYWIVVEALDNGHTAAGPDEDDDAAQDAAPDPWFVRIYQVGPLRRFAHLMRRLSRPWRRELQLVAERPALALGFGLGIAALLAVPLLALAFRPAAVVGAVHLLGRVDEAATA